MAAFEWLFAVTVSSNQRFKHQQSDPVERSLKPNADRGAIMPWYKLNLL